MIGKALSIEDVREGEDIPPFEEELTFISTVRYAAATWDFVRVHYEQEYAKKRGLSDALVDGQMLGAYMARLVGEWTGDPCSIRKLSIQYRQMVFPGDIIVCKGKVAKVSTQDGRHLVECELSVERKADQRVAAVGRVTAELPSRATK